MTRVSIYSKSSHWNSLINSPSAKTGTITRKLASVDICSWVYDLLNAMCSLLSSFCGICMHSFNIIKFWLNSKTYSSIYFMFHKQTHSCTSRNLFFLTVFIHYTIFASCILEVNIIIRQDMHVLTLQPNNVHMYASLTSWLFVKCLYNDCITL